jgi:hypothetical protein
MLFISQLERKTTQRLPSPQRKDGLTDGRTDGQTSQTVGSTSDRKGKKPQRRALLRRMCHITPKKKQNPSFLNTQEKNTKPENTKLMKTTSCKDFAANSRHISSSSSSSSYYYYYYYYYYSNPKFDER